MHYRLLPQFCDLGSFVSYLDGKGQLRQISAPVSMRFELTEIHRRVIAARGPALRITMPTDGQGVGSSFPVVANIFGTRERVAWGLGTDVRGLETLGALLAWMRSPQVPQNLRQARQIFSVARGALAARPKIVSPSRLWKDAEPDFAILPVQTCWPDDAGPLITWPVVVTRPPGDGDPGRYNLGVYRMQSLPGIGRS